MSSPGTKTHATRGDVSQLWKDEEAISLKLSE
jgi:hypothetical protein